MMEMYIEQGASRMDCELKIASKYNRPFTVIREKKVNIGGFLGLFSKQGVQVEFIFSPALRNPVPGMRDYNQNSIQQPGTGKQISNLEDEKIKILAAANVAVSDAKKNSANVQELAGKAASQEILDTLKILEKKIDSSVKTDTRNPAFENVTKILKLNDFSESYINEMLERMRKELTVAQLENPAIVQDHLIEWIGESITIYEADHCDSHPKIMVLVGPTGVGKTTTISKLAAIYGLGTEEIPAVDVRMITIDAFRICAKEQLEQIGYIMRVPVCCVINKHDLRKEIAIHSESTDLFLIDTIGKSPKEASKLGEMKEILEGAGRNADFHLVISAATKSKDISNILQQFEPFNYKSVILTKMDETDHYGNIISALSEKKKPVSFFTDGQAVPVDIKKASVIHFLINMEGFKVNREKMEKRFPQENVDQFKWR